MSNPKLFLLSYTRRLRLVVNNVWKDPLDSLPDSRERWAAIEVEMLRRQDAMDSALDVLCLGISEALPLLEGVALSAPDDYDEDRNWLPAGHSTPVLLGPLIMRQLKPRFICATWSSNEIFQCLPVRAKDWRDRVLPEAYIIHSDLNFDFDVMWGARNMVFVDFKMWLDDPESRPIDPDLLVDWVWPSIVGSIPHWARSRQGPFPEHPHHDMDKQTTIDIHGLVNHQVLDCVTKSPEKLDDICLELESQGMHSEGLDDNWLEWDRRKPFDLGTDAEEAERRLARLFEKYIALRCWKRHSGTSASKEFWTGLIKVSTSKEAVFCPACGV
ncbi:hypothetical protein EHS25_006896 [Saitozyma podzolica]|uniref:Uncharacterized protein n=1 Tax=Saitozyma podzolica TaxID=1890683 RepID=A0A427XR96_9TREE|nr:hypothetical protein EHS25_006896 [Saitozyma podzolica]